MYIIRKIIFKKIIITLVEKFKKKIIRNAEDRTMKKSKRKSRCSMNRNFSRSKNRLNTE